MITLNTSPITVITTAISRRFPKLPELTTFARAVLSGALPTTSNIYA